jgi:hypothetical protein
VSGDRFHENCVPLFSTVAFLTTPVEEARCYNALAPLMLHEIEYLMTIWSKPPCTEKRNAG